MLAALSDFVAVIASIGTAIVYCAPFILWLFIELGRNEPPEDDSQAETSALDCLEPYRVRYENIMAQLQFGRYSNADARAYLTNLSTDLFKLKEQKIVGLDDTIVALENQIDASIRGLRPPSTRSN